ncbi:DNA-formamidopyrimidine glycosylase family protein [Engelhardtia mirabilis]|uniref:Fpg/Nei family DNA glycosylase n=1 Tax=Engelhardtia mirabilis TaxID=2528011 RepID=UPI0011A85186
MPELPDIVVYVEALERFTVGRKLLGPRLASPFVLRSVDPPLATLVGRRVTAVRRLGKRLVLVFEDELFLVLHPMIAGRLRWKPAGASIKGRGALAAFDFEQGTLIFSEASKRKRASIHVVRGEAGLAVHDRGGLDLRDADRATFLERLRLENRTLKRALVDPTTFDGIGNAYSDEILHRARLSPFQRTRDLDDERGVRLQDAARDVLREWTEHHRAAVGDGFPDVVTAFHPQMAVHGKYGQACPVCNAPVQRVIHAENEFNYCPGCQTEGRILADRVLSRLLKDDWPRSLDEL